MADKKLNEVTKVTDMAYVPVIMADGSIGQIAKADLASVVAGLIPESTRTKKGLMGAGVRVHTGIITIPANSSVVLPYKVAGLLLLKNGYSWGGYNLYCGFMNILNLISTQDGYNPISSVSMSNGEVTVGNAASAQRQYRYVIFNMSDPNDPAEFLID